MKEFFAFIGLAILGIGALVGVGWVGVTNGYFLSKAFAPKFEQVRRTTFEQSQAYVEGQRRDMQNLELDWKAAPTQSQKDAIKAVALQRMNGLPSELADIPEIRSFRNELTGENQ